jgi:spectinomycin phosphotransferase
MLEKPEIQDQLILSRLWDEYGLHVKQVSFLPLGADVNTAVYQAVKDDGSLCFLKLRKGDFDEIGVTLPYFLKAQGITSVIAPLETRTGQLWGTLESYTVILYPFIEGKNGYEATLSNRQWLDFGAAMRSIHQACPPPDLARRIPRETYSPYWREMVKEFQAQVEKISFPEPVAARVATLMRSRRSDIDHLVARGDELALRLQSQSPEMVLCHSDIHAGNLLISTNSQESSGALYIVDWDAPTFALKERDLSQVGGCPSWNDPHQVALFYQGYGSVEVDRMALVYYRYERIIQDIAAFCESLLMTEIGGDDQEQFYGYFSGLFSPGHEIEIAFETNLQK